MADKPLRISQLLTTFGPGSLYIDKRAEPQIVCGLDHWFKRVEDDGRVTDTDHKEEFRIVEPRLSELLHVQNFFRPPDYRTGRRHGPTPPNAYLTIPVHRMPRWYRNTRTSVLKRVNLDTHRIEYTKSEGFWVPVRFVAVCAAGHLSDFPWQAYLGCTCPEPKFILTDTGGTELTSVFYKCENCQKRKTLVGTTMTPGDGETGVNSVFQRAQITCTGEKPWLGLDVYEPCTETPVAALTNQLNLYFPKIERSIFVPDLELPVDVAQVIEDIGENNPLISVLQAFWTGNERTTAINMCTENLRGRGIDRDQKLVERALASIFSSSAERVRSEIQPRDQESTELTFKRVEFNVLRRPVDEPNLTVIPTPVSEKLGPWFQQVKLVDRLRETTAFYGFDRLRLSTSRQGLPQSAMEQLFLNPPQSRLQRWLPAFEVFGEGIYIELRDKKIKDWQTKYHAKLQERFPEPFITRLSEDAPGIEPPLVLADWIWASRFLLTHSLAHILINQLVFECGYSTAALKERLYVSADPDAPMAGLLIYTADGDSEGTLGGLVRLGKAERLQAVVDKALNRASWCSADPVCSESNFTKGARQVNYAACHACLLLPETCCPTINNGLDRATVVGEPGNRAYGWMSELLAET